MSATPRWCAAITRVVLRTALHTALLVGILGLVACSSKGSTLITRPTATTGDLTLTLDRATYTSHQPFGVTVNNTSKTSYYAKDGLSACTYLQLEYYDSTKKTWLSVDGCSRPYAQHVLLLAPTSSLPFTLAPGDSSTDQNAWVPGVYRVSLRYGPASDGSGNLSVVYSTGFVVTE
jgi:hypothetical protein